jgi:toluene monooxygenase system protein E
MSKKDDTMFQPPERATFKVYSHLADKKRIPNEYEVTSSKMLYYPAKGGFEVHTPISDWYEQYQKNSLIKPEDLAQFVDPSQTTYTSYIKGQKDREIVLDALSRQIEVTHYDKQLDPAWIEQLSRFMAPLRYPWHGFQMISSYMGSMAPEGKVAIVCAFQAMNEMRRIQRIAYRMRQLQQTYPPWGNNSLADWQKGPHWQPLRKGIEHLLVTYDWLEAFVALNLCFKPLFDHLVLIHFAHQAKQKGDYQLDVLFHSFWEDVVWQQAWSTHLLELLLTQDESKSVITQWLNHWVELVVPAVFALEPFFGPQFAKSCESVFTTYNQHLINANLSIKVLW